MSDANEQSYAGMWHCCYWFPSNTHDGQDISEYYVTVHERKNKLVIESLPNTSGAHMFVNLTVDNDLATGTWEEHTAPAGEFGGSVYSGALQLLIDEGKQRMQGKWVGVGQDDGQKHIYSGRWELMRIGSKESAEIQHTASKAVKER